jgi:hypothetical protein
MSIPLIAITPTTAAMLAQYHENCNSPNDEVMWLRVGLILEAAQGYTAGRLTEENLRDYLDLGLNCSQSEVRAKAYELLGR